MSAIIALELEVPITCFRQSRAREYVETYQVPPPATLYGCLLSMIGEQNRYRHQGCRLAIAMISSPQTSTVLRTFRRFKRMQLNDPTNARPDYQQLLTDVRLQVWVEGEKASPSLAERLDNAFKNPASVERFGGLSLGESRDLINAIDRLTPSGTSQPLHWLIQDQNGELTLPYWVDHVGASHTRWQRYTLETSVQAFPQENAWTTIQSE